MQVTFFSKIKIKIKTKTMQVTHLSQIHLPMINNFDAQLVQFFKNNTKDTDYFVKQFRLPFDSLNKITTMISVTRLQMEIDKMANIKQNQI